MTYQIKVQDLEGAVRRLNRLTQNPEVAYLRVNGRLLGQVGNYHIDSAYGGKKLVQMSNTSGGIHDISDIGYATKRELYDWIHAYIKGIEVGIALAKANPEIEA